MSDIKVQLMKLAAEKLKNDKLFMSSIFSEYKQMFRIADDKGMIDVIWLQNNDFTELDYYKLCLCGVPNVFSESGESAIKAIAAYTNIKWEFLQNILNTVFRTNSKGKHV